jgi:MarR family 2-MHQ and catechol resistance regulon transcriptional repressor
MTTTSADLTLLHEAEQLSDALEDLLRVVQFRDRDRACCYDISVSQCYALERVVDAGGLTVNELAASLYLDKSTASRIANSLVTKGYLGRARDPEDGRVVRLVPTPAGTELCRRILADIAEEYAEMLADFSPEVRSGMVRLVGRLARSFSARVETSGGSCCVVR